MNGRWFHPDFPVSPRKLPFFYGWLVAFGSTLGMLFTIPGQTMGFSVFTEILMEEFGLSRVSLSSAYFVGTVASGMTLPYAGRLFDRWGARQMIVLSSVATGLVLLFLSVAAPLARSLAQLCPASWAMGIGCAVIGLGFYLIRLSAQGVLTMTTRNVIGKWFDIRRGLAMSISGIFVSFGFAAAPKLLDALINQFGYDGTWRLLGIVTLLVMAPLGWLIFRDNPEECGMQMDGDGVSRATKENPDMVIHRDYTRAEAARTFSFHAFNLSFAFFAMFSTAFTFHIESIGQEFGFLKSKIIDFFLPMAAISVATNLFFGWANSKTKLKYLLLLMNLGAVTGALGLYQLDSSWGVPAYIIGNGITGGIFTGLGGVCLPRFYGRKHLGAISGINMSTMVIASGLGPWAFALAHRFTGSYEWVLLGCLAIPASLCVASLFADNPQRKLADK